MQNSLSLHRHPHAPFFFFFLPLVRYAETAHTHTCTHLNHILPAQMPPRINTWALILQHNNGPTRVQRSATNSLEPTCNQGATCINIPTSPRRTSAREIKGGARTQQWEAIAHRERWAALLSDRGVVSPLYVTSLAALGPPKPPCY